MRAITSKFLPWKKMPGIYIFKFEARFVKENHMKLSRTAPHVVIMAICQMFFLVIPSNGQVDKSKWPRVAPVIFIHGVGSAPPTWGVKIDKETVPAGKPMWPSADDSKTGGYFWYKPEIDSATGCRIFGVPRPMDLMYTLKPSAIGPDGENILVREPEIAQATKDCMSMVNGFENKLVFQAGQKFTTSPNPPNTVMRYDFLQSGVSNVSRNSWLNTTYTYNSGGIYGIPPPSYPTFDAVGGRRNGVEFYDAFWTHGWPDGNVPDPMKGLDGMLYGTALSGTNHKWVKAKYSRSFVRHSSINGPTKGYITYLPEAWSSITFPSPNFHRAHEVELLAGSNYAPGNTQYSTLIKTKTEVYSAEQEKRTITYKYSTTNSNIITVTYVIEDKGYTGKPLQEETKFGQIGQLYIFIKKTLDKYYTDSNGFPNWYLGNGVSDPDAKIVLVGHSQGGVLARGVSYPGFGSSSEPYNLENGYEPMYYPKDLRNNSYLDFYGFSQNMNDCYFDVRNHLAGIVTISSPHFGSPIGYAIDGVIQMHKNLLEQKQAGRGLYHNIWDRGTFGGLDNYTISQVATEVKALVGDINPVNPIAGETSEGFSETVRAGLRKLHNYSSHKTHEPISPSIRTIEEGRDWWQQSVQSHNLNPIAPPSYPCIFTEFPNGAWANNYRLYWQPEFDNWVRSFRKNEENNGGLASEKVHTVNSEDEFRQFGQLLCEEQIGRYTRLSDVNDPNWTSSIATDAAKNPFAGTENVPFINPLAKSGLALNMSFNEDVKNLKDCLLHMVDPFTSTNLMLTGAFVPPIVNPLLWSAGYQVYNNGSKCIDDFKVATNQTAQGIFHTYLTNAAQGAAYNLASVFLHRLNQRGGPDGSQYSVERRPPPARPDKTPIPFISVTNNLGATSPGKMLASGAEVNGDLTVNTLSMDIGFAYPDLSKSGSIAKFAITGATHTMATTYRDTLFGPWYKVNSSGNGWEMDKAKNYNEWKNVRSTLSNLIFGLAIGQSPVLPNQGNSGAKIDEIENAYTQKDTEGFILQRNNKESVQGRYTRLKGINPDEIFEPIALPLNSNRTSYLIDRVIVVNKGQELYIPSGATLQFTISGTIIVKDGGRLTLGGVPSFSSSNNYSIRFVSPTVNKPDIRFRSNALLKYPASSANLLKSRFLTEVNGGAGRFMFAAGKFGNPVTIHPNHLYGAYDSRPYTELIASSNKSLADVIFYPGALNAATSILH
jgi:triacylglycerol esterase/lipase EstA (alpha/beta hydrolase family)